MSSQRHGFPVLSAPPCQEHRSSHAQLQWLSLIHILGAGSICSNVKSDKKLVVVKDGDEKIETGLKKFGAMLGDHVEVGCGSVLNPGTVIGRNSNIYPLSPVRGCVPADSIYKNAKEIVKKK